LKNPSAGLHIVRFSGPVRYRFRASDEDVEVLLEGEAPWVESVRVALGLDDSAVGWTMPLSISVTTSSSSGISKGATTSESKGSASPEQIMPGPPPDPSRIPSVIRSIGTLNPAAAIESMGIPPISRPKPSELESALIESGEPDPLEKAASEEPLAEAWVQRLLSIAVREHGVTALSLGVITELLGRRLGKDEDEMDAFLSTLWKMSRIERVHATEGHGYAPSPHWLEAK